jgi:catechol 2,3-dioxygenase-like lactoylglutathione lyase family enzyme
MARIRHLAILTEDVQRLVKFYTNSFGLKIVQGVGTATYLTDGHINLAIIPIGPEREIEGNQLKEGINHFGFEVESVEAMVPVCKQWGAATDVKIKTAQPRGGIPRLRSRWQRDRPLTAWMAALNQLSLPRLRRSWARRRVVRLCNPISKVDEASEQTYIECFFIILIASLGPFQPRNLIFLSSRACPHCLARASGRGTGKLF